MSYLLTLTDLDPSNLNDPPLREERHATLDAARAASYDLATADVGDMGAVVTFDPHAPGVAIPEATITYPNGDAYALRVTRVGAGPMTRHWRPQAGLDFQQTHGEDDPGVLVTTDQTRLVTEQATIFDVLAPAPRVLGSDAARAVGRFVPGGPDGYRARSGGPLRETRAEAVEDERRNAETRPGCDAMARVRRPRPRGAGPRTFVAALYCTLDANHDGPHEAHGLSGDTLHTW